LVCVTEPSSPGLKIRTGTLTLLACFCSDVASELASWSLDAFWPTCWTPPDPPPDCPADWSVALWLPAADVADESLVCVTEPSSPGLMMRTEMFWFRGWTCVEVAAESADC
jgi:hypothetical protein